MNVLRPNTSVSSIEWDDTNNIETNKIDFEKTLSLHEIKAK